jgi:hypothetical protein
MFEIGDKVFWLMGHGDNKVLIRGLYYTELDSEFSEVNTYENNNRFWQTKQKVLTLLLQKDAS